MCACVCVCERERERERETERVFRLPPKTTPYNITYHIIYFSTNFKKDEDSTFLKIRENEKRVTERDLWQIDDEVTFPSHIIYLYIMSSSSPSTTSTAYVSPYCKIRDDIDDGKGKALIKCTPSSSGGGGGGERKDNDDQRVILQDVPLLVTPIMGSVYDIDRPSIPQECNAIRKFINEQFWVDYYYYKKLFKSSTTTGFDDDVEIKKNNKKKKILDLYYDIKEANLYMKALHQVLPKSWLITNQSNFSIEEFTKIIMIFRYNAASLDNGLGKH